MCPTPMIMETVESSNSIEISLLIAITLTSIIIYTLVNKYLNKDNKKEKR